MNILKILAFTSAFAFLVFAVKEVSDGDLNLSNDLITYLLFDLFVLALTLSLIVIYKLLLNLPKIARKKTKRVYR